MSGEYRSELLKIGLEADSFVAAGKSGKELHGPCPLCHGGTDRFVIYVDRPFPSWNFWCRVCGQSGWADQLNSKLKVELPAGQREAWAKEACQKKAEAEARRRVAQERFCKDELWLMLHNKMQEAQRAWWDSQGIPGYLQDFYQLGFVADKSFDHDGAFFKRDAYTIPKFGLNYQPLNMDYRIVDPPLGVGKYRPAAGLPAACFLSRPDYTAMPDELFIVEGSKKAMIVCHYLEQSRQVVGVPSCNSWAGAEALGRQVGRVWIMLDPDAQLWAKKLAQAIGPAARLVAVPAKPDDWILAGAREREFQALFRYARQA